MELLEAHFVQDAVMIAAGGVAAILSLLALAIALLVVRSSRDPDGRALLALHPQGALALVTAQTLPPDSVWQRRLPARAPPSTHRLSPPRLAVLTRE